MQRIEKIYNRTKTIFVPSLFIMIILLLLVLSSRIVLIDAITVKQQKAGSTRFGTLHTRSDTVLTQTRFSPTTELLKHDKIQANLKCKNHFSNQLLNRSTCNTSNTIRQSTPLFMVQFGSESKISTGINFNNNRIRKWNTLLQKHTNFENYVSLSKYLPVIQTSATQQETIPLSTKTTALYMTTTSSELKNHHEQQQQQQVNDEHVTSNTGRKSSRTIHPYRCMLLAFVVSLLYNQTTSRVANAAVLSSVAIAASGSSTAAAAGVASSSGIIPSFTNYQLTIVAVMILLNAIGNVSFSMISTCIKSFASWYMFNLNTFPLMTKAVTAGVIGIIGDYMAQWLEYLVLERKNTIQQQQQQQQSSSANWLSSKLSSTKTSLRSNSVLDFSTIRRKVGHVLSINGNYHLRRGLSILADGMLISGPLMHIGYNYFEKIVPICGSNSLSILGMSSSTIAALTHVIADSIVLDSIFIASTFIMTGLFEGYTPKQLIPHFKIDYIPSLKASWLTSLALLPVEFVCFRFLPLSFRVLAVNFIDVIWDAVISFMAHRNRNLKQHPSTTNIDNNTINDNLIINNSNNDEITVPQELYQHQERKRSKSVILN
jgi:Mpv17 / PMP22 family